jgi:hypothetical protein
VSAAPYSDQAATAYTQSIEHVGELVAVVDLDVEVELDVASCVITMDETWSPLVQLSAVLNAPNGPAALAELDPRVGVRLVARAGYRYPGGSVDVHTLADVELRTRIVTRPANDVQLRGDGDEVVLQDNTPLVAAPTLTAPTLLVVAIADLIDQAHDGLVIPTIVTTSTYSEPLGADVPVPAGTDLASLVQQLADRANLWVYCDELRVWHIADRPTLGSSVLNGTTGQPDSTLTRVEQNLTAELPFANAVLLTFDDDTTAYAQLDSGPFAVGIAPRRVQRLAGGPPPASADGKLAQAVAVLTRASSRGEGWTFEAPAAYWLRPGQSVTVQLGSGEQLRQLVARVSYSLHDGRMTVTTRTPGS